MFDPARIMDAKWAFSSKKQADYATLVTDANMSLCVPVIGTEVAEISRTQFTDEMRYGKGHEFATMQRELTRDIRYARRRVWTANGHYLGRRLVNICM